MVINLYNEKDVNTEADLGLIQNLISRGLTEGQFPSRNVKMNVVKADKVGEKFKNAVKNAKNAQYLDDADLVVVFQTAKNVPDEAPAEEPVSESVKVQDLSKSLGLKDVGSKKPCGCKCGKKAVKEDEAPKKAKSKKDLEKKAPEKEQAPEKAPEEAPEKEQAPKEDSEKEAPEEKAPVKEAEVEATGDKLKVKIVDTIKRVLYLPKEEDVEMVDLEDFLDGFDVFFTKLSFKD